MKFADLAVSVFLILFPLAWLASSAYATWKEYHRHIEQIKTAGGEITPVTVPDLPVKTRVKVPRGVPGASPVWTGYVASAPIRAADGLWYVAVMVYGGVELHPVDNLVRC